VIGAVPYAYYAKNTSWGGVSGKPTYLSNFTNDLNFLPYSGATNDLAMGNHGISITATGAGWIGKNLLTLSGQFLSSMSLITGGQNLTFYSAGGEQGMYTTANLINLAIQTNPLTAGSILGVSLINESGQINFRPRSNGIMNLGSPIYFWNNTYSNFYCNSTGTCKDLSQWGGTTDLTNYYTKLQVDNNFTLYYPISNPSSFWNSTWAGFNKTYADTLYAPISVIGDNASWNKSYADTLYYSISNPLNFVNSTSISNSTIARNGTAICPAGNVLMNVTTNSSGVFGQCVVLPTSTDTWSTNQTNYYNKSQVYNKTEVYNITQLDNGTWVKNNTSPTFVNVTATNFKGSGKYLNNVNFTEKDSIFNAWLNTNPAVFPFGGISVTADGVVFRDYTDYPMWQIFTDSGNPDRGFYINDVDNGNLWQFSETGDTYFPADIHPSSVLALGAVQCGTNFVSSDGSQGVNTVITYQKSLVATGTMTFKNGILVGAT
jgi:hypothetical protein